MNSKDKGKRGEIELSNIFKSYGYDTRRGQQYCGANGDADVVGLKDIQIECKRVERINIDKAMEQAKRDASVNDTIPTVFHRRNNKEWLVTMQLDQWMKLYKAFEESRADDE